MHTATPERLSFTDHIEETFAALALGAMTLVTFANVVARYVFETNILWALETTVYLFAWLVLIGASYCVKRGAHLGVDVILNIVSPPLRRAMTLTAAAACLLFSLLLLKGCWDYWANFANLPQTTGRWFPTGFQEMKMTDYRAWYQVDDIRLPGFLKFLEDTMNEGEEYEKMPRFIPYLALPVGIGLLTLRFIQASWRIVQGTQQTLIASHEVEDDIEAAAERAAGGKA